MKKFYLVISALDAVAAMVLMVLGDMQWAICLLVLAILMATWAKLV